MSMVQLYKLNKKPADVQARGSSCYKKDKTRYGALAKATWTLPVRDTLTLKREERQY